MCVCVCVGGVFAYVNVYMCACAWEYIREDKQYQYDQTIRSKRSTNRRQHVRPKKDRSWYFISREARNKFLCSGFVKLPLTNNSKKFNVESKLKFDTCLK